VKPLLHYAGAVAVLLAGARFASALPKGPPRVVRIVRDAVHGMELHCFTEDGVLRQVQSFRHVSVHRYIVFHGALLRECYSEKGHGSVRPADFPAVVEATFQRAEARAARGDDPDRVEPAPRAAA
jgi:hypothetical protein